MGTLAKKKNCQFFSNENVLLIKQLSVPTHSTKLLIFLLVKMLNNIFTHYASRPFDFDQMGMRWIRNNSAGKNNSNRENIW